MIELVKRSTIKLIWIFWFFYHFLGFFKVHKILKKGTDYFTKGTLRRFQMLQLGPCAMADPGTSAPAMVRRGTATASRGNKGKRKRSSRATSGLLWLGSGWPVAGSSREQAGRRWGSSSGVGLRRGREETVGLGIDSWVQVFDSIFWISFYFRKFSNSEPHSVT